MADGMTGWRNGRIAECWNGGMAEWQNDRMAEWQNGRMAEWQNGRMAEWRNGRMAEWQNGRMAEWQNSRMAGITGMADRMVTNSHCSVPKMLMIIAWECGLCEKTNEDIAHRHCHICGIPCPVRDYVVAGPNCRCIYGQFKYLTNDRHTTINLRRHPMNAEGVCNARTQSLNSYRRTWILSVV